MATKISQLGKVAFTERLLQNFKGVNHDDAAIIDRGESLELVSEATFFEGVDFDLQYFPLSHLGYKAVTAAVSNICAMNGTAQWITVSIGLSSRFMVEDVDQIYEGVFRACSDYKLTLIGGNTSASLTGLTIAISCIGQTEKSRVTLRRGACNTDIVC
ncbi:MAG: AIR synthase related protein, partial [Mucinivorans sp.]